MDAAEASQDILLCDLAGRLQAVKVVGRHEARFGAEEQHVPPDLRVGLQSCNKALKVAQVFGGSVLEVHCERLGQCSNACAQQQSLGILQFPRNDNFH